ncbi:flippase [Candidatus Woesearchaeota archaeon]|nr:flippase [Candidatus Woesearchaeota archaeon]
MQEENNLLSKNKLEKKVQSSVSIIGKGTVWLTLNQFIFLFTSYITYVYLARKLGAELFGVYGVVISLVTVVSMVLITGTQQVVAKFVSENPAHAEFIKRKALKLQLLFSGSITIIYFLLSSATAYLLHDKSLIPFLQLSALIILFHSLFSVFMGYFNGLKLFKQQALFTATYHIVRMILTVIFVMLGYKVFGAIGAFVLSSILFFAACLLFVGFNKIETEKNNATIQKSEAVIQKEIVTTKRFISFSIPIMLYIVVIYLLMNIDLFFLKSLSGAATANLYAGYYTAVQTIARIPYFVVAALPVVLFPLVSSSSFAKNVEKTKYYIKRGLRYTLLLLLPLTAAIAATAKELLILLYSAEYVVGAKALFVLVIGMMFLGIFTLFTTYISGSNKPKMSFYLACITLILAVLLNYFLVQKYSMIGAAVATAIALFLGVIIIVVYVYREYGVLLELDSFLRICYATVIMYIAASLVHFTGYMLLVEYLILGVVYLLVLYLSKEINEEDVGFVKRLIGWM